MRGTFRLCFIFSMLLALLNGLERCSLKQGAGVCPTGNTCCRIDASVGHEAAASGCVPNDLGSYNATCCPDALTGCGVGYSCKLNLDTKEPICVAGPHVRDPLVQILPRYKLCSVSQELVQLRGFPIDQYSRLPYYSSHGDITRDLSKKGIRMLLIVVHGAGRDADEYFSAMKSAVELQRFFSPDSVLLVAPRFPLIGDVDLDYPDNTDGSISSSNSMRWNDTDFQGGGGWRYGADSVAPAHARRTSSFEALDFLIGNVTRQLRDLDLITVAGHSSGGQFVQRYALLSPIWEDERYRAFVANPSSFAYLSPLRYSSSTQMWYYPNKADCPGYNEWEWGLEVKNVRDKAPYVRTIVGKLGVALLIQRFAKRHVLYAAGSLDICNVSESGSMTDGGGGWCDSHGLETTCMDMLEGSNRWERHNNYVQSLEWIHHGGRHESVVVEHVGHDHSLIFQSQPGLKAIFDPPGIDDGLVSSG